MAGIRGDDAGVLALVPDDWWDARQRRHHVLSRLAEYFPVAWISPAVHWRAWPHAYARDRAMRRRRAALDPQMLVVASAGGAPAVHSPALLRQAIVRRRVLRGARWLRRRGCRAIELQIWRPELAAALDWVAHETSSYHIDDEYSWSSEEQTMAPAERRLIERVDRVYVASPKLLETKGGINPHTILSPNGVDYHAFSTPSREPDDLSRVQHPRVGYVGVLKEQLDWELITAVATAGASWSFVFVGPVREGHDSLSTTLARLQRLPNVHLLGEKSAGALPGYLQHMDVAVLPYRRNAYTDCINPMKLYEALAAGVPIVGSRIRTLEAFAPVVTLAESADEWIAGIEAALSDASTSAARRIERQAIAQGYDWDTIVGRMAESMEDA